MLEGYRDGGYDDPVFRYPEYFFMPCAVACLYGALVAFEAYTSQIFGHVHDKMVSENGVPVVGKPVQKLLYKGMREHAHCHTEYFVFYRGHDETRHDETRGQLVPSYIMPSWSSIQ